jgi:hypothetical protein
MTGIHSRSGVPIGTSGRFSCPGYSTSWRPLRHSNLPRPRVFSSVKYTAPGAGGIRQRARYRRSARTASHMNARSRRCIHRATTCWWTAWRPSSPTRRGHRWPRRRQPRCCVLRWQRSTSGRVVASLPSRTPPTRPPGTTACTRSARRPSARPRRPCHRSTAGMQIDSPRRPNESRPSWATIRLSRHPVATAPAGRPGAPVRGQRVHLWPAPRRSAGPRHHPGGGLPRGLVACVTQETAQMAHLNRRPGSLRMLGQRMSGQPVSGQRSEASQALVAGSTSRSASSGVRLTYPSRTARMSVPLAGWLSTGAKPMRYVPSAPVLLA